MKHPALANNVPHRPRRWLVERAEQSAREPGRRARPARAILAWERNIGGGRAGFRGRIVRPASYGNQTVSKDHIAVDPLAALDRPWTERRTSSSRWRSATWSEVRPVSSTNDSRCME